MQDPVYDLAVIGGGINGCGIARDAAGRGLSVFLCERDDLGGATSSASTKLIHGGLRYLEHYEFRLVREALIEREVLLRAAPHLIRPLRLVLPHHAGLRPRWLLRLGLFVYDHLGGGRTLPGTRSLDLHRDPAGQALKPELDFAFEFSDCRADDSRLVVLNAIDARARGASINPRTRCVAAERQADIWSLTLEHADRAAGAGQDRRERPLSSVSAKVLVNAAGPWVGDVLHHVVHAVSPAPVRLVKGSHIVVPRLFDHDRAYMFQNADGRIVFAIPYEQDFTLIGTTDRDFHGDPAAAAAEPDEIVYLCATASEYFRAPIRPEAVVWSYSGVRPLYDDGASQAQEATRDYVLDVDAPAGRAPLLSVFGGKITTYRRLAEAVLARLSGHLQIDRAWTATARLPGGDLPAGGAAALVQAVRVAHPSMSDAHVRRLVRAYGSRVKALLCYARHGDDLGERFGGDLTGAEVDYLIAEEWARNASDVLWRRTKLGLRFSAAETAALDGWMADRRATPASAA
jgi:glycerol-3-phosphate dehydrogenase